MPNLKFVQDKTHDAYMVMTMFKIDDSAGLESRANSMGINLEVAQKIRELDQESAEKLIEPIMEERYKAIGDKLEITSKWYQQSWDEINDQFFSFVAEKTKHEWKFSEYFCVVSVVHPGLSDWQGNKITRIWSENPFTMRKITAHELILAHIFSIFHYDPKYQKMLSDQQVWKIAEISAWCLTGLEPEMLKFWPWIPKSKLFYYTHNYPMLVELQKKLKVVYEKSDFETYLNEAVKLVKTT